MKRWYKCRPSKWTGEGRGRRALSKRDCCHKQNQTLFILLILLQVWFSTLTHLSLKQDWFQFLSGFGKSCHSQGFSNLVLSKSFLYPSAWSPQRIAKCPEHTIASFPLNSGRQYFITCLSALLPTRSSSVSKLSTFEVKMQLSPPVFMTWLKTFSSLVS